MSRHSNQECDQSGPSRFTRGKSQSSLEAFQSEYLRSQNHRHNLNRQHGTAHTCRFPCMRSCPSDFFIDQTRAVCAEPLTSGVAISESCLKTAAANAVAGFTCFRKLQADLQRARIDVKWSSPMPTGLSRLLPRISNLLAQSMLSPVQEITYQHSMSTLSVEKYRKRLIIPTQCAINMADSQGENEV